MLTIYINLLFLVQFKALLMFPVATILEVFSIAMSIGLDEFSGEHGSTATELAWKLLAEITWNTASEQSSQPAREIIFGWHSLLHLLGMPEV